MIVRAMLAAVGAALCLGLVLGGCPTTLPGPSPALPGGGGSGGSTTPAPSITGYIYLDTALQEYVLLAGRDSSLEPIEGATVRVVDCQGMLHQTRTDANGYWQLFSIPQGAINVSVLSSTHITITSRPATVDAGQTLRWPASAVRVRVDEVNGGGGTTPAPQPTPLVPDVVRRVRVTTWDANFGFDASASSAQTRQEDGDEEEPITAVVKIEFYGQGPEQRVVVRVEVHNSAEAWAISSETVTVDGELVGYFEPSAVNLVPGGYTAVFTGSVLNDTFRVGQIEEAVLPGVSYITVSPRGDIRTATYIDGWVHAQTDVGRTLIGSFAGAVDL